VREGDSTISNTNVLLEANATVIFEGNFSDSSSALTLDPGATIIVKSCFTMNNSSLNVDLKSLTASQVKIVEAQCIKVDSQSKFDYKNVPSKTCPRTQVETSEILILMICESSGEVNFIPILITIVLSLIL